MSLSTIAIALLTGCIVLEVLRELAFKVAAAAHEGAASYYGALARSPILWLGVLFWAVEMTGWVMVLQRAPLTIAFPIMTLTYAAIPVACRLWLGERLTGRQAMGASLVAAGVLCVGLSGR